jgi:hypothetical protein
MDVFFAYETVRIKCYQYLHFLLKNLFENAEIV